MSIQLIFEPLRDTPELIFQAAEFWNDVAEKLQAVVDGSVDELEEAVQEQEVLYQKQEEQEVKQQEQSKVWMVKQAGS